MPRPTHYAGRPTGTLQARRAYLLALSRYPTIDEAGELQAIEAELQARQVLSIGLEF